MGVREGTNFNMYGTCTQHAQTAHASSAQGYL